MAASIPEVFYIVADFGKLGRETVINWEACTKRDVIDALIHGEPDNPIAVHCVNMEDKRWADVSEDIAREIVDGLTEYPEDGGLYDFLEDHLGCAFMAELAREMAPGRSDREEHSTLNRAQQGV